MGKGEVVCQGVGKKGAVAYRNGNCHGVRRSTLNFGNRRTVRGTNSNRVLVCNNGDGARPRHRSPADGEVCTRCNADSVFLGFFAHAIADNFNGEIVTVPSGGNRYVTGNVEIIGGGAALQRNAHGNSRARRNDVTRHFKDERFTLIPRNGIGRGKSYGAVTGFDGESIFPLAVTPYRRQTRRRKQFQGDGNGRLGDGVTLNHDGKFLILVAFRKINVAAVSRSRSELARTAYHSPHKIDSLSWRFFVRFNTDG